MRWYYWIFTFLIGGAVYKVWFAKANFLSDRSIEIANRELREVSGLVASVRNPGYLWVHNDGSRPLKLFLLKKTGFMERRFKFSEIVTTDFEDIALDGDPGMPVLYAGDIGDNSSRRKAVRILRLREPLLQDSISDIKVDTFYLSYPNGSRDAEAMFVDPVSKYLYIVSKRDECPFLYKVPLNIRAQDTVEMKLAGNLKLSGTGVLKWVTAADISADGSQILVRSYGNVFYWHRKENETVEEAMRREPDRLSHTSEIQGEAIGFSRDGKGFYTLSEGEHPKLNFNYID
ncbi:MAG TPA: hypothetical protein VGE26_08905 [Sphingobacteriaceae bacterium]